MNENIATAILLIVAIILDGLLAMSDSAFKNSHRNEVHKREEADQLGAKLASRIVEDSSQLILTMRVARGLLRLVSVSFALITLSSLYLVNGEVDLLNFVLVLMGFGLVIGVIELIGEAVALRSPENWACILSGFTRIIIVLLKPITIAADFLGRRILGVGEGHDRLLVTEEEIMTLVDAGEEGGVIEEDEKAMIYSIFQLGDTLAREVMVPRIDILGLDQGTSLTDVADTMLKTGHSRAPVFNQTIDNVVGLVYLKDILAAWRQGHSSEPITLFIREAYFVPEAMKLDDLLAEMQVKRIHMAIVVDEYGGTAGLVTIEDIVEEIVGEIHDEYDLGEEERFQQVTEGEYLFSGGIDLDDVNQITESDLPKDTSETLGGFIYSQLGRVPISGEVVEAGGLRIVVEEVSGRRIRKVRASRVEDTIPDEAED
ncbi:MAG: DUF21 domain-containing protein [Anaerolineales bacterium]|nr:DUF21 domain-containing protein [Anaerolineales bacterium]